MRTVNVLLISMFAVVCRASPPTYDHAVELASAIAESIQPDVKRWMNVVFTPFAGQHFEAMVASCAEYLGEGATAPRFVIDVHAAPERVAVQDEVPTPFSKCLKAKLEALTWPKPPVGLQCLPIAINANRPKDGPQNADDVIISITPSNNSLERTRDR